MKTISMLAATSVVLAAALAQAEPCTLYKPQDLANARANVARYAWAQSLVNGWRNSVRLVLERDRQFIDEMISPRTPWPTYGQSCPACVGKESSMGETGLYRWRVDNPDRLVCKYCGTVYPNAAYPETGKLVCPRMGQTFTYYLTGDERSHPEDTSGRYAFRWASWPVHTSWSGVIRSHKADYVVGRALPLAKLYALTGEVQYAQRAAWILDRLAAVYPQLLFHSYNGTYADCPPAEAAAELGRHPRGGQFPPEQIINAFGLHRQGQYAMLCNGFWGAGRLDCSGGDGGMLLDMAVAYDLIHEARAADGTPVLSPAMDKRIVNDLLLAGCADMEQWQEINNKCGPGRALSAAIGCLFQRPESARRAYEGYQQLLAQCFHFDGFCRESPSYSDMHLGLMREIPEILRGFSDPPNYRPAQGGRLDDLDPFADLPRYRLALESMVRMAAPGGSYPVIGDTHYGDRVHASWVEILADRYGGQYASLLEATLRKPLSQTGSEYALWYRSPDLKADSSAVLPLHTEWFPGWQVGVLRGRDPQGETALYLNGYAAHGHRHADTLGLIYYALGKELVTDRGYIWDDPRNAWTRSTLAHNLVTVDAASQNVSDCHSHLEFFGTGPDVQVVAATADAYRQCSQYRRTCALVSYGDGQSYAVDFFRAQGGHLHQYGFHADGTFERVDGLTSAGDAPSRASSQPAATATGPAPRALAATPLAEQIKWLSNLRSLPSAGPFAAIWKQRDSRVALLVLSAADRVVLADAPGWRSGAGSEMKARPIQQLLVERKNTAGDCVSRFAAVIVPYAGDRSPVLSAKLIGEDAASGALAIEVRLPGRTDYICSSLDEAERTYGPVTMAGRFGMVSRPDAGKPGRAYLLGGTHLACGDVDLRLPASRTTLKVASVSDRTFVTTDRLPDGLAAQGHYVLANDTGWEIESSTGTSITVRDYPVEPTEQLTLVHSAQSAEP